jgi:hypothetical protein
MLFSVTLLLLFSTLSRAETMASFDECTISTKSPTKGFSEYHTIEKVLYSSESIQFSEEGPSIESEPARGMLLITSQAVGGALSFNVGLKSEIVEVIDPAYIPHFDAVNLPD